MAVWYCGSTKHAAVAQWAAATVYAAGSIVRQLAAPAVGSERCFRTALGGTSAGAEPAWVLTKAAAQPADNTIADWVEVTGNTAWGWLAAHARLSAALAWLAAGDTLYVSHAHAETQAAAMTLTSPGAAATTCLVLCVNDGATPPTTLATTGTVTTTGNFSISFLGFAYVYGLTFTAGSGANATLINFTSTTPWGYVFDSCSLVIGGTSTSTRFIVNGGSSGDDQLLRMVNTSIGFSAASTGGLTFGNVRIEWYDKESAVTGTSPATLLTPIANMPGQVVLAGLDLSTVT